MKTCRYLLLSGSRDEDDGGCGPEEDELGDRYASQERVPFASWISLQGEKEEAQGMVRTVQARTIYLAFYCCTLKVSWEIRCQMVSN